MSNKSFIEQSKIKWEPSGDRDVSHDEIQIGCLQRIADATEVMAKNYNQLLADKETYKRYYLEYQSANQKLYRRISALQGVITKLRNKNKPHE